MLYRKLDFNGEVYPIAVGQHGKGAPTEDTPGLCGITYLDTDTSDLYVCISDDGKRRWKKVGDSTGSGGEKGDPGSGYSRTQLWKNENIDTKFSSQTISLPLNNYDAVEVVYAHWSTSSTSTNMLGATGELPVMDGWITHTTLDGDPNYPTSIKVTTSGIEVTVTDREANIPYIIYGIKHGNSTGEVSYTNVLDSVGYQTDKCISSGDEEDNIGTDLTGFIKVVGGDVIRLKNVTMPDVNGYANRVYCYQWGKNLVNVISITSDNTANSPVFENGNLVQFTIREADIKEYIGDEGWIRIGAANIDTTSIITVNEEIE